MEKLILLAVKDAEQALAVRTSAVGGMKPRPERRVFWVRLSPLKKESG